MVLFHRVVMRTELHRKVRPALAAIATGNGGHKQEEKTYIVEGQPSIREWEPQEGQRPPPPTRKRPLPYSLSWKGFLMALGM